MLLCAWGGSRTWRFDPHATWPLHGEDVCGALERQLPDGFCDIETYNDHSATTHADIMALFDRAIEAAESAA